MRKRAKMERKKQCRGRKSRRALLGRRGCGVSPWEKSCRERMVGSWAYWWEDGPPPPSRVSWIPQQLGFLDSAAVWMSRILKKIDFSRVVHELGFPQKCRLSLSEFFRNERFQTKFFQSSREIIITIVWVFQKSGFPDLNQNGSKLRVFFKLKLCMHQKLGFLQAGLSRRNEWELGVATQRKG